MPQYEVVLGPYQGKEKQGKDEPLVTYETGEVVELTEKAAAPAIAIGVLKPVGEPTTEVTLVPDPAPEPFQAANPEQVGIENVPLGTDETRTFEGRKRDLEALDASEVKAIAKDLDVNYQNKQQAIAEILEKEGLSPTL